MNTSSLPPERFADTKRHYPILDGLRGVAALMVVAFHLFEAHAASRFEQVINHGYLAVDFFFVLSGFVIGYAYDDRWGRMSAGEFFKRRLIRLHPMIIAGMVVGALAFYFQDSALFAKIHGTPIWQLLLVMVVGMTLVPLPPSMDIRGWDEMHPLNGPAWSLFFEYVANILYALFIRKFSNKALALLVFAAGCVLLHYTVAGPSGDVIGGWSLNAEQLRIGFTRLTYPFFAGLLLSRVARPDHVGHAFLLCSVLVVAALAMPRIGGAAGLWMNGLYESLCIIGLFPLVVYLGASGDVGSGKASRICDCLGQLSYPLYMVHYPFVYAYTAWVARNKLAVGAALPVALLTLAACVALAWLCLKFYDLPVRRWLGQRLAGRKAAASVTPAQGA